MALKACKECRKEISTEAKTCPNCGKKNPTASGTHPLVWAIVVLIIVVMIGGLSTNDSSAPPPPPPQTPEQIAREATARLDAKVRATVNTQLAGAVELCHQAAERRLKAPATAKWHDDETYKKNLGKGRSEVQLQVDAENSFSALIRTTVDCKTRQTPNGDVLLTSIDSWQR